MTMNKGVNTPAILLANHDKYVIKNPDSLTLFKYSVTVKASLLILLFLSVSSLVGCGGGPSSQDSSVSPSVSGNTTKTTINFSSINSKDSKIPANIHSINFMLDGFNMTPTGKSVIITDQSSISATFDVPNGSNRKFVVEALDPLNNVLLVGRKAVLKLDGTPLDIIIHVGPPICDISGEWGALDNEFIVFNISQSTDNNSISGTWTNSDSGCSYTGVGTFDRNTKKFSITFTTDMDPNSCCSQFTYEGTLFDNCTSMNFNWSNVCDFQSGRGY